jgi:hypothetical protein
VGGSVRRLSCHVAIASKESHENHVRIVGCHSSATKKGRGRDTVVLIKIQLLTSLVSSLVKF